MIATNLRASARLLVAGCAVLILSATGGVTRPLAAQVPDAVVAQAYIDTHAEFEDMVYVPMRDGVRLYHMIIFPKGQPRQNLPTVIIRIPYLINVHNLGFGPFVASFLKNGYAVVWEYERGKFFSEGEYTYIAHTLEDGQDLMAWLTKQPWSNGKAGLIGCSSSAEEQLHANSANIPGLAAIVPMAAGAGIGKVGPYNEMGNFFRGGAVHLAGWVGWYNSVASGNPARPVFPSNMSRDEMIRVHNQWNMVPNIPLNPLRVDSAMNVLPINKIMDFLGAPKSDFDKFVNMLPNDPRFKETEWGTEEDHMYAPMLAINSWYDISIGPNVSLFEHTVKNGATASARDDSRMVVAPTLHCAQTRATEQTIVGEKNMGDARYDYVGLVQDWFDHFVKGVNNDVLTKNPRVRAYMMGVNQWRTYDTWPPRAQPVTYYLDGNGAANTRFGDGRLTTTKPSKHAEDKFIYDPMTPVPSHGGGTWCCYSHSALTAGEQAGVYDQRPIEMRNDVLVYTSEPLASTLEVMGPIKVSMYLSSDRKDTDLTVKLLDIDPAGHAYNIDESIQRVRWREGWDHPVFMEAGKVYKVEFSPLTTGNAFLAGHRIGVEISSSNFPHYERNLNTGGNNYDEKDPLIAHNVIHHGAMYLSSIELPVVAPR